MYRDEVKAPSVYIASVATAPGIATAAAGGRYNGFDYNTLFYWFLLLFVRSASFL